MQATIITIGDEILIGHTVDTNSAWIGRRLNESGIKVYEIISISDTATHIKEAVAKALGQSEIVLVTGGLGPTKDDVTKKSLAEYFDSEMVLDEQIMEQIASYIQRRGRPLLESHRKMAYVPAACQVIQNHAGTAAAMWFEQDGKVLVSMPGVPYEMKDFMDRIILEMLQKKFSTPTIIHQLIMTAGLGESIIEEKIKGVIAQFPDYIKLAYLPGLGGVKLRLSGIGVDEEVLKKEIAHFTQEIQALIPKYAYSLEEVGLEQVLGEMLKERGATIACAESCTGGLVGNLITAVPGSSAYFKGGAITYSNEMKTKILGVKESTLASFGAVSEETVKEMLAGAIRLFDTDYAIAVSGIAGPDGGTPEKPVGTVWVAVGGKDRVETKRLQLVTDRSKNVRLSAMYALFELRKLMLTEKLYN